jgi:multisubunit Na+/H+ antiporter MnhB subunit
MTWFRYVLYFISIAFVTWALTQMEIASPGSLKLHVVVAESDIYGTSEFSPVEIIQAIILGICGLIMLWVARYCPSQRPIAFGFGGLALVFLIRESDYFLDRFIADNLWQVLVAIIGSLLIAYTYRHRKRLTIALARIWPSPGLTLLFAGAVILFAFVPLVGHEPLWQSILGDAYQRVIKLAIEEIIELMGYYLWMIGTIEYAFQARAIAYRAPQPAARRKRDKRRRKSKGTF